MVTFSGLFALGDLVVGMIKL